MGLLSVFQFTGQSTSPASVSDLADAVQQARLRARHRLMGAAVLLIVGIIVFPLLFETQPRPVAIDIPIEIPRRESALPLAIPPSVVSSVSNTSEIPDAIVEAPEDAGREVAPAISAAPVPKTSLPGGGAILSGSGAVVTPQGAVGVDKPSRFVLQAGAFSDGAAVKDVRAKLENLGFKTFIQIVETPEGKRTRVRVGPFSSKDDAEKVLVRLKASGLSAVILAV